METDTIKLEPQWLAWLRSEFDAPYMAELKAFLVSERRSGQTIFPKAAHFFRALDLTPPDRVKVVILGQDPYHGEGQAEGLCFSVPKTVIFPWPFRLLGGPGGLASQFRSERASGPGGLASGARLGTLYRRCDCAAQPWPKTRRVYPVGGLCSKKGGLS